MNFLAHTFLSFGNEDLIIGNFIADFISIKEMKNYPEAVQNGIILHREIDQFTDNHPSVKKGTLRLQPHHHKYAPVVIDILYDYLLANNWTLYSEQSLESFAESIYRTLNKRFDEIPLARKINVRGMIEGRWLESYKTKEGLRFVLQKMDRRASFPSNFAGAINHLEQHYGYFEDEFNLFFPQLMSYLSEIKAQKRF